LAQVGGAFETGPLAVDTHLVRIPAPRSARARAPAMAKGDWRLDWVALAELGPELQPTRLAPRAVAGKTAAGRAVAPRPGEPIVTQPGDAYTFDFELPEALETQELFLSSRATTSSGSRQSWLQDESACARHDAAHRRRSTRVLAPAYKRQEADGAPLSGRAGLRPVAAAPRAPGRRARRGHGRLRDEPAALRSM
jgi:hypothetical protein